MTATEDITERTALPVCLPPWLENPYRLVSLWDIVQKVIVADLCKAASMIGQMHGAIRHGATPGLDGWSQVTAQLKIIESFCNESGLYSTLAQVRRVKDQFQPGFPLYSYESLARDILEVSIRLEDDLKARRMFSLPPERGGYFDECGFDETIFDAFPSVQYDAQEAGKCFAVARNTACVFHLMRVLEIGLGPLAKRFSVTYDHTNWETIINRIEKAIAEIDKDPNRPANWKDEREFYSQSASYFRVLKDAWRNYTAHARGKYDEQEALDIFGNVRGFMQRLATRLRE